MPSARPPRGILLLALIGAVVLAVTAQRAGAEDETRDTRPEALTQLEAGPFRTADVVVIAQVERVKDVRSPGGGRGRQLVQVRVKETLQGTPPKSAGISIMVLGQRPTLNPDQPSVPYFRAGDRDVYVLFLARSEGQHAYRLQTLLEGRGRLGAEKIAVARAVATLGAIEDRDEKGRRTLAALIAMSRGEGRWTKTLAARELNYLARVRPELFDARTRNRLRRMPSMSMTPDQREWMRKLFKQLELVPPGRGPGEGKKGEEATEDAWRGTFRGAAEDEQRKAMLTRLLTGGEAARDRHAAWAWNEMGPALRRWYARAAADRGVKSECERLRALYSREEDPDVRAAVVRAIGLLGGERDVAWLAARADNLLLRRPALLALARLDLPKARAHLETRLAAGGKAGEKDLAAWIAYLLGDAFAEAERRAGRR